MWICACFGAELEYVCFLIKGILFISFLKLFTSNYYLDWHKYYIYSNVGSSYTNRCMSTYFKK